MHRASMGARELRSNWPEMRKTLVKPGFCSTGSRKLTERTGTELLGVLAMFLKSSKGKENGWPPKKKFDSRSFFIWFVATMLHVLQRCASHQEQESQALERRRRRRMEIGKSASTANRNQQKNADREIKSQPNLMSVVPVRGRHYIRMKKGMVSNLVLTVWHL